MARKKQPHILIVNGVNLVGQYLVQTLLEQDAFVYVLGQFDTRAREFVKRFKDVSFKYFDISVAPIISSRIEYLDYVIILLYETVPILETLNTRSFLAELSLINDSLELAKEKKAKVEVVTSMLWERRLSIKKWEKDEGYTSDHVQAFAEKALVEYSKKQGLDGRVVRLGEVYGRGMDVNSPSYMVSMIKQALKEEEIVVPGDGLQFLYYIHVLDAVYGILKALFSDKTKGEKFTLANPQEISLLSLAHKILEQTVVATKVRFEKESIPAEPLFDKAFVMSKQLTEIGWKPKISFERGLAQTVDYFKEVLGVKMRAKGGKARSLSEEGGKDKESGILVDVKVEEILPVEMSREQERIEKVKKKIATEKARRRRAVLSSVLTWAFRAFLFTLFLLFYFFLLVPMIGLLKTTYFTQKALESYLIHLKTNDLSALKADRDYIKGKVDGTVVYLDQLAWLFKLSGTESAADRIVANLYGVEAFTDGCDFVLTLKNGQYVLIKGETPKIEDLRDSQAVSQAKLEFEDASAWLKNGTRLPNIQSFWKPFEEAENLSSQMVERL